MVRSMTGFGRARGGADGRDITVEIKSVNNRYFDCSVRISRLFSALEEKVRAYIQSRGISRGKIDVFVGVEIVSDSGSEIALDGEYAASYVNALRELRDRFGLPDDISVMTVAANSNVFKIRAADDDVDRDWSELEPVLSEAVDVFISGREKEGKKLADDILAKLDGIKSLAARVEKNAAAEVAGYREKLETRLRAVLDDNKIAADENRIITECAIFADKVAIDEELVRLRSHFSAFAEIMSAPEPVGRKLDFLLQEINRETNTIGSKCCSAEIARIVVEMKSELEKIREQIQNLE